MLRVARALGYAFPVTCAPLSWLRTRCRRSSTAAPTTTSTPSRESGCRRWRTAGLVDAVDVFCESIAFTVAQAERLFAAARALGVPVKMHAEQLSNLGGTLAAHAPRPLLRPPGVRRRGRGRRARRRRNGRCCCRWRSTVSRTRASRRSRRCAPPARDRGRQRLQSGLVARHLASDRHEHGDAPVRAHRRRGTAGGNAPRGPGPRSAPERGALARSGRRLRGLERRRPWRSSATGLVSTPAGPWSARRRCAMAESEVLKLGARPLQLADLRRVYAGPVTVAIDAEALGAVRDAHAATLRLAADDAPATASTPASACSRRRASRRRSARSCSATSSSLTARASDRCSMTPSCGSRWC